jgi:hypothetical protein
MGSTPWLDCHEHMHLRGAFFHVLGLGPCLAPWVWDSVELVVRYEIRIDDPYLPYPTMNTMNRLDSSKIILICIY